MLTPSATLAYQSLTDNVSWFSQSRGDTGSRAIAFVPHVHLDTFARNKAVQRAYYTFVNHDPRPANAFGEYPRPLRLCHQDDLSYINVTEDHLKSVLFNYFRATLPGQDLPFTRVDDEELGVQVSIDEEMVAQLANECADDFIANAITVRCMLMEPDSYSLTEHGAQATRGGAGDMVESLVDAATR